MTKANGILAAAIIVVLLGDGRGAEAEPIDIWPADSTELKDVDVGHIPKLYLYHGTQTDAKRPAVLITPAGGYKHHSGMGTYIKWLNRLGIAAYEVKYRLPVHGYKHPAPLHDAQRSMRILRHKAEEWGIDPNKIGVLGGSSGGHLLTTLATHWDRGNKDTKDPIEQQSCRPDYCLMFESVVTMKGKFCHTPSRARLLPEDASRELIDNLSNELQVNNETPPAFVIAGGQDALVPAENSLMYFQALRQNNVAFSELHFYSHGGHGFVAANREWKDDAQRWLGRLGVIGDDKDPNRTKPGRWGMDNKTGFEVGSWSSPLAVDFVTKSWDVSPFVRNPGEYAVQFQYASGANGLEIEWLAVEVNGKEIHRDTHAGSTGYTSRGNVYKLKIDRLPAGARVVIKASVRARGGEDTNGSVNLQM